MFSIIRKNVFYSQIYFILSSRLCGRTPIKMEHFDELVTRSEYRYFPVIPHLIPLLQWNIHSASLQVNTIMIRNLVEQCLVIRSGRYSLIFSYPKSFSSHFLQPHNIPIYTYWGCHSPTDSVYLRAVETLMLCSQKQMVLQHQIAHIFKILLLYIHCLWPAEVFLRFYESK